MEEKVVLGYFMQIVNGISYMHKQNVIHRDLKTANIFKTKQDCLKIGDFGVSKIMTTKFRKAHTMIGILFFKYYSRYHIRSNYIVAILKKISKIYCVTIFYLIFKFFQ